MVNLNVSNGSFRIYQLKIIPQLKDDELYENYNLLINTAFNPLKIQDDVVPLNGKYSSILTIYL